MTIPGQAGTATFTLSAGESVGKVPVRAASCRQTSIPTRVGTPRIRRPAFSSSLLVARFRRLMSPAEAVFQGLQEAPALTVNTAGQAKPYWPSVEGKAKKGAGAVPTAKCFDMF